MVLFIKASHLKRAGVKAYFEPKYPFLKAPASCRPLINGPLIFKTGIAVEIRILRPLKGGGLLVSGLHSGQGLRGLSFRAYRGLLWRKEFNLESGGEVWHLQTSKYCWNTTPLK